MINDRLKLRRALRNLWDVSYANANDTADRYHLDPVPGICYYGFHEDNSIVATELARVTYSIAVEALDLASRGPELACMLSALQISTISVYSALIGTIVDYKDSEMDPDADLGDYIMVESDLRSTNSFLDVANSADNASSVDNVVDASVCKVVRDCLIDPNRFQNRIKAVSANDPYALCPYMSEGLYNFGKLCEVANNGKIPNTEVILGENPHKHYAQDVQDLLSCIWGGMVCCVGTAPVGDY